MVRVNLIPARRLAASQRRRRLRRWVLGDILGCSLLLLLALLGTAAADRRVEGLAEQAVLVEAGVDSARQAIATIQPQLKEARLTLDASRAMTRQPDWSILLVLLSDLRGDQIVFRRCHLQPAGRAAAPAARAGTPPPDDARQFELHGIGRSESAVSQFVLRLEQTGLFEQVKVVEVLRQPYLSGEAMAFELWCRLGESGGHDG